MTGEANTADLSDTQMQKEQLEEGLEKTICTGCQGSTCLATSKHITCEVAT